jgi:formyl-CoA transferase
MAGALEGVRVLDCTQIVAGPLATTLLGEMGAEVVKVEPLEGEPWRLHAEIIPKESRSYLFYNRGKLGIAVDLRHPGAAPVREALIRWADVLVTNYRPGVPEELGVDYASARAIRPDIIYCECTAFGTDGPDAQNRGFDIVAQAMSGLATSNPNTVDGQVMTMPVAPADIVSGTAMAWAITGALYHRLRTGEGQAISGSLLHTALALQHQLREITALDAEPRAARLAALGAARARGATIEEIYEERKRFLPETLGNVYYRVYKTKDSYLAVGCLGPGPRQGFRDATAIHDPRYDADFSGSVDEVRRIADELTAGCEALLASCTNAEWIACFREHRVPCGPVRFADEMWDDPQVVASRYIETFEHPLLGQLRQPGPIVRMSASPTRIQRPSPMLGEHTAQVLGSLGFREDEIARLRSEGVIG